MREKVRVGLIGTSVFAERYHLAILRSHPQADVVAICGRNEARAQEIACKYAIPTVFTDYRAMIETAGLDAAVVVAPDDQHYAMTMDALDAGLHVLCEKPLALTLDQARAMYAKAEAAKVKHMVNFTYRWLPVYRYVYDLIQEGHLGRCYHFSISHLASYARDLSVEAPARFRWRFDSGRANGVLGDLGTHMIDMARLLIGEIRRVSAHAAAFVPLARSDGAVMESANQSAILTIEFANGAQGMIHVSAVADTGGVQEQRLVLHGEAGSLVLEYRTPGAGYRWPGGRVAITRARAEDKEVQEIVISDRFWEGAAPGDMLALYQKQSVADRLFVDAILADRPITPSFFDGLKAQEVIAAAITAHQTGTWVSVE